VTNTVTKLSTSGVTKAVGVDLGATDLWVVGLDGEQLPRVSFAEHLRGEMFTEPRRAAAHHVCGRDRRAGGLSAGSHHGDQRLARKFQRARCSEVASASTASLCRSRTPMEGEPLPAWMATGFRAWRAAEGRGTTVVETYRMGSSGG